ncbi:hypothetical protein Leryth_024834 [Lithospermum erythrorhizon]|nr:hypothetical protein Leryth_024834 [Lithospermum erythrorhizon]
MHLSLVHQRRLFQNDDLYGFRGVEERIHLANIDPWTIMRDESLLVVFAYRSSCFYRNEIVTNGGPL